MVLLEFTPTNHYVHTVLVRWGHEAGANELCGHHIMMASRVLGINQGTNGMEGRIYMPIIVRSHQNSHLSHGTFTPSRSAPPRSEFLASQSVGAAQP